MPLIKRKTRVQMCQAMESWCNPGNVIGLPPAERNGEDALTNTTPVAVVDDKVLRGKVLHEVREILRMAHVDNFTDIVSWSKSGTSFKIHDRDRFKEHIMKKYLTCAKLTYLSDTLRSWGFCRLKQGKGEERQEMGRFRRERGGRD